MQTLHRRAPNQTTMLTNAHFGCDMKPYTNIHKVQINTVYGGNQCLEIHLMELSASFGLQVTSKYSKTPNM